MTIRLITGDCLAVLPTVPADSVHCVVTSPPYFGLRDYGVEGQIGMDATLEAYVERLVDIFAEVRRVLRPDGTLWLNLGDSYAGSWGAQGRRETPAKPLWRNSVENHPKRASHTASIRSARLKPKDLMMVPARVALALQAKGWWLRSDIIWAKPNPMPESVTDRPTSAHEHIFLLTKSERYWFDADAVRETASSFGRQHSTGVQPTKVRALQESGTHGTGGDLSINYERAARNIRNVWTVATQPYTGAHFATFPPALIEPCIKAGCPVGGLVLDPFGGAGTTGLVADRLRRNALLIEINPEYVEMAGKRIGGDAPLFAEVGS